MALVQSRLRFAFTCLVSLGMAVGACSDDDDADSSDDGPSAGMAGNAGSAARGGGAGSAARGGGAGSAGRGGAASAGRANGGSANSMGGSASSLGGSAPVGAEGGAPSGDAGAGGMAGGSIAEEGGAGGQGPSAGAGGSMPEPGTGGAGAAGEGGFGGEPSVGGEGGSGGEAPFVPDTVDNGDFEKGETRVSLPGWMNDDVQASYVEYNEAGARNGYGRLAHWSADPYTVTLSQVVGPIPNGTYRLGVWVNRAASAEYEQYIFARNCGGEEVQTSTEIAGTSGWTEVVLSDIEVTAGSCEIGIYSDDPSGGMWANFDDLTFTMQ